MRLTLLVIALFFTGMVSAQEEGDTVLKRCPVYITDTVSLNNYFLEFQPSTIKVYRAKGRLTIEIKQRDQFFTIFFTDKKLKNTKYKIFPGARGNNEAEAKYSFRSGEQVSYVDVRSGTIETSFDDEKDLWHLKLNGMIANLVERTVSYYRVRADFYIR
jgi:hypothetical protein